MFDIFTKSKAELGLGARGLSPVRPSRIDSAWRVYRAIDRALKTVEVERKILESRIEEAAASGITLLAESKGVQFEDKSPRTVHLDLADERIRDRDRAGRLDRDVACYKLLRASLLASFPELGSNGRPLEGQPHTGPAQVAGAST